MAIRGVLARNTATRRDIERLVGHMTFCSLARREVLCSFSAVYAFARTGQGVSRKLWPSVRRELM
eukprot:10458379-Lingulodinium_polyedra.AAC.1